MFLSSFMGIAENKENIQQTAALSLQRYRSLMYGISPHFHVLFTLLWLLYEFKWEKCIKKKQILFALNMSHSLSLLVLLCKAWTCVCVCVCVTIVQWWRSKGSEQLAGPHLTTYWPALHSPVIQPNLMFPLSSAAAELQLTSLREQGKQDLSNLSK